MDPTGKADKKSKPFALEPHASDLVSSYSTAPNDNSIEGLGY